MKFRSTLILVTLLAVMPASWAESEQSVQWLTGEHLLTQAEGMPGLAERFLPTPLVPELRPRLSVSVQESTFPEYTQPLRARPFSWSVEAWQLNTASLAHIQCSRATLTLDTYLAQDCRVVDRPLPDDSLNLVQVRGRWLATPGLAVGFGAFHGRSETGLPNSLMFGESSDPRLIPGPGAVSELEGVDMNLSFGVHAGGLGDLLVDLQLSRYRQRDIGIPGLMPGPPDSGYATYDYRNAAQLALGWRKGDFRGDILGQYREAPVRLPGRLPGPSFSSFDIEFSWRAPWNALFSVGASNVLDQAPAQEAATNGGFDDPMESIYGRIPYVRYKQDL